MDGNNTIIKMLDTKLLHKLTPNRMTIVFKVLIVKKPLLFGYCYIKVI